MKKLQVPRTMGTQHPDNVTTPFFSENPLIGGEDEIRETYYSFSHLGVTEQMWDYEGKEVDGFVIKKLLAKYPDFFRENQIGKSVFITPRVPNPEFEKSEAKMLLETLESIPRSFDTARAFYGKGAVPPIFEVILPMTTSSKSLDKIYNYYREFVGGKGKFIVSGERVSEWIGDFGPREISVIPLFEDKERLSKCGRLSKEYLKGKNLAYQRVFLARSDPAMNYGLLGAVLLCKVALAKLDGVSKDTATPIHPIIGVGSVPFRGGLAPNRIDGAVREYPSVSTFTIQSAFKYDWSPGEAEDGIEELNSSKPSVAQKMSEKDEREIEAILSLYIERYEREIMRLARTINWVSEAVPQRRKRKLHVGIWGYSRKVGRQKLPRAIGFTASLYSLGYPPELVALDSISPKDLSLIERFYPGFFSDISEACRYADFSSKGIVPERVGKRASDLVDIEEPEKEHQRLTSEIASKARKKNKEGLSELVVKAASIRKFLG